MANDYKKYYDEGFGYLKSLKKSVDSRKYFSHELKYNICTMGTEKFLISILMYYEMIPYNHTLSALARDVMEFYEIDKSLYDDLEKVDSFQDMCSLEVPKQKKFSDHEIELTESAFYRIHDLASLILCYNGPGSGSEKEFAVS